MKRATRLFDEDQKKRVNDAVAASESKTTAEIIPVVASASGRYDRAEDIVGLWVGVLLMIAVFFILGDPQDDIGAWGGVSSATKLWCSVAAVVLGFLLGAAAASYLPALRRLFTPRRQMHDEVAARARQVFFDSSLHHTVGGTGVLVYVSLYERIGAVLADQQVLAKLGQKTIDELCHGLTEALSKGNTVEALSGTVERAGEKLAPVLPRSKEDVNELPDSLVTID